jgi:hypothetical protein
MGAGRFGSSATEEALAMKYHIEIILCILILTGFVAALLRTILKSPMTRWWVGGAWAIFVTGFIEGCPIGSPVGAGIAGLDGQVHADLGMKHLIIEAAHVLAVPFFTGLADLRSWTKQNPFPNPFTQPDTNTIKPVPKANQ